MDALYQKVGQAVVEFSPHLQLEDNGVLHSPTSSWTPADPQPSLGSLHAAMLAFGIQPSDYSFLVYDLSVMTGVKAGEGEATLRPSRFPSQLAIVGPRYVGLHQLNLVLRNPVVTAVEIASGLKG